MDPIDYLKSVPDNASNETPFPHHGETSLGSFISALEIRLPQLRLGDKTVEELSKASNGLTALRNRLTYKKATIEVSHSKTWLAFILNFFDIAIYVKTYFYSGKIERITTCMTRLETAISVKRLAARRIGELRREQLKSPPQEEPWNSLEVNSLYHRFNTRFVDALTFSPQHYREYYPCWLYPDD